MAKLADADLSLKLSKEASDRRLVVLQHRLLQLRLLAGGLIGEGRLGPPLCVVFEGWDASGKGGAIKRLVAGLDPRHYRVQSYSAPTEREKRHHFLWRFYPNLPGWGGMAIFDRSWYGRALVERVEGYATRPQWQRSFRDISDFEGALVADGTTLVKFWLHISASEQLRRFEARRDDPLKAWKLTEEDWRNREKRPAYLRAVADVLGRTDHRGAPWVVVAAESKHYARAEVLKTVVARMEKSLTGLGFDIPPLTARALQG